MAEVTKLGRALRIIGLGNPILSDDAIGLRVAQALRERLQGDPGIEVVESEAGGFELLELMSGWPRVALIDAVSLAGLWPGRLVELDLAGAGGSLRLASVHEIDLGTALALGRQLGQPMPEEVLVFGVQGADLFSFSEQLTPALQAALPAIVEELSARLLQP